MTQQYYLLTCLHVGALFLSLSKGVFAVLAHQIVDRLAQERLNADALLGGEHVHGPAQLWAEVAANQPLALPWLADAAGRRLEGSASAAAVATSRCCCFNPANRLMPLPA